MRALWLLIPDEAMILIVVGLGLALMLRLLSGRAAVGILGALFLMLILGPFVEVLLESLPGWVGIVILVALCLMIVRTILSLCLGQRAADHTVGILAANAILFGLLLPFRVIRWMFRR